MYGRPVVVLDGVFSAKEVELLRHHVEHEQLWSFDDQTFYDDGTYDGGDNVKWLGGNIVCVCVCVCVCMCVTFV